MFNETTFFFFLVWFWSCTRRKVKTKPANIKSISKHKALDRNLNYKRMVSIYCELWCWWRVGSPKLLCNQDRISVRILWLRFHSCAALTHMSRTYAVLCGHFGQLYEINVSDKGPITIIFSFISHVDKVKPQISGHKRSKTHLVLQES